MFVFWQNTFCVIAPIMFWGAPEYTPAAEITVELGKKTKKENKILKQTNQSGHMLDDLIQGIVS